ncbi:MAG: hypothetical protein BroJett040_04530 [Oligoflexia bacterium]|nr:MAG: hypothetical protein BroJett040_04530 [Oligoflexia bacterium]
MKLLKVVVALTAVFSVGVAQAQKKEKKQSLHDQFTGQSYGMAGCGLGSVVFGDKPGMIQVIAAFVNATGYQTFAISSGTSNCGESGKAAKATQFIETNKIVLEKDIVRGQGETLTTLSQLMECKNSSFGETLKSNYSNTFPQGGASSEALQAVAYQSCQI